MIWPPHFEIRVAGPALSLITLKSAMTLLLNNALSLVKRGSETGLVIPLKVTVIKSSKEMTSPFADEADSRNIRQSRLALTTSTLW